MNQEFIKVPAEADDLMDQALLDVGVKFVELIEAKEQALKEAEAWERDASVQRIIRGAKCVGLCAGIGLVLLWWLKAGFLAPAAAWPSFIVVALIAGVGLGSCLGRR